MTFSASPVPRLVPEILLDTPPVAGMGTGLAAGVTLDADITLRMAGLAGLKIAPRFGGMLMQRRGILLSVGAKHQVRLDPQTPLGKTVVAFGAVFLIVATIATLRIVPGLDRMNGHEVAPVALGHIVATEGVRRQVGVDPSPFVTIEAERLRMALGTVVGGLLYKRPVALQPIPDVVGCNPFRLVTVIAFSDLHVGIFFVLLFLGHGLLHVQG